MVVWDQQSHPSQLIFLTQTPESNRIVQDPLKTVNKAQSNRTKSQSYKNQQLNHLKQGLAKIVSRCGAGVGLHVNAKILPVLSTHVSGLVPYTLFMRNPSRQIVNIHQICAHQIYTRYAHARLPKLSGRIGHLKKPEKLERPWYF